MSFLKAPKKQLTEPTNRIAEVDSILDSGGSGQTNMRRDTQTTISKPVRPREFSLWMAALLIGSFAGLAIALATLFIKARPNGMCPQTPA